MGGTDRRSHVLIHPCEGNCENTISIDPNDPSDMEWWKKRGLLCPTCFKNQKDKWDAKRSLNTRPIVIGPPLGHRHGRTYDPELDLDRLNKLSGRVWNIMLTAHHEGKWLVDTDIEKEMAKFSNAETPSIGARYRDYRKPEFGFHYVFRIDQPGGAKYFLIPNDDWWKPWRH